MLVKFTPVANDHLADPWISICRLKWGLFTLSILFKVAKMGFVQFE
jgi:hypothetical protein